MNREVFEEDASFFLDLFLTRIPSLDCNQLNHTNKFPFRINDHESVKFTCVAQ